MVILSVIDRKGGKEKGKKVKAFLFNDMILFAKSQKKKLTCTLIIERNRSIINSSNTAKGNKHSIEVISMEKPVSYLITFTTSQTKEEWFQILSENQLAAIKLDN